mgnify:CR=1 FL=1
MADLFLFILGYIPEKVTVVVDKSLNFRRIHYRNVVIYTKIVNSGIQGFKNFQAAGAGQRFISTYG